MDTTEDIKRKTAFMASIRDSAGSYFPAFSLRGPSEFYDICGRLNPRDKEDIQRVLEAPSNIYFILSDGHLSFLHLEDEIQVRAPGFHLVTRESFLEKIKGLRPGKMEPEETIKYESVFEKIRELTGELLFNEQLEEVICAVLTDLPKAYLIEMHDSIASRKELTNEVGVWYQRIGEIHKDGFV